MILHENIIEDPAFNDVIPTFRDVFRLFVKYMHSYVTFDLHLH